MTPALFANRAEALVGAPFRLGGRDPLHGLDCVGLVACALGAEAEAPRGYALRNTNIIRYLARIEDAGFALTGGKRQRGDLVLVWPGPLQHHLLVALGPETYVHAHLSLRRVVIQPGPLPWPELARWRLPTAKD